MERSFFYQDGSCSFGFGGSWLIRFSYFVFFRIFPFDLCPAIPKRKLMNLRTLRDSVSLSTQYPLSPYLESTVLRCCDKHAYRLAETPRRDGPAFMQICSHVLLGSEKTMNALGAVIPVFRPLSSCRRSSNGSDVPAINGHILAVSNEGLCCRFRQALSTVQDVTYLLCQWQVRQARDTPCSLADYASAGPAGTARNCKQCNIGGHGAENVNWTRVIHMDMAPFCPEHTRKLNLPSHTSLVSGLVAAT